MTNQLSVKDLKSILSENDEKLSSFGVQSLYVFGSVAKGTSKKGSDVDILVNFLKPVGFFQFLDLKYFLEEILNLKVDLATDEALHPKLKDNIKSELIRVA